MWRCAPSFFREALVSRILPALWAPPAPRQLIVRSVCASPIGATACSQAPSRTLWHPQCALALRDRHFSSYQVDFVNSVDHPQPCQLPEDGERQLEGGAEGQNLPRFNIDVLVSLLKQENAKDICVIRVPLEMGYTDYFVIASASSSRHLQAMAQYALKVYKHLKERNKQTDPQVNIEGKDTDDWMCIDFGNIVVHFMLPETREIYELEKLWTLRSYDDQLAKMAPEILPEDFIFGLAAEQQSPEVDIEISSEK
ncbi:mitochondrial assembly of ribosomal large subunit protein 1 [Ambystoma mexicanum]|uniref:mitochondrial assembly of ribosomal large subunit protein 1 n=1 Tax=Ambystoma mexicanum TaxID=8296 RepID=UPI0037E87E5F